MQYAPIDRKTSSILIFSLLSSSFHEQGSVLAPCPNGHSAYSLAVTHIVLGLILANFASFPV